MSVTLVLWTIVVRPRDANHLIGLVAQRTGIGVVRKRVCGAGMPWRLALLTVSATPASGLTA